MRNNKEWKYLKQSTVELLSDSISSNILDTNAYVILIFIYRIKYHVYRNIRFIRNKVSIVIAMNRTYKMKKRKYLVI